jgi:predicted protein tyrosine phosphatase
MDLLMISNLAANHLSIILQDTNERQDDKDFLHDQTTMDIF